MIERAAVWLEYAGVKVPRKANDSIDAVIEISPTFALDKEDVRNKKSKIPQINAGDTVYIE